MFDSEVLELELKEYKEILLNKTEGLTGRRYLKYRNITKETAEFWELGYCPLDYTPTIYKNTNLKYYKKMSDRLIVPIRDQNGKLITLSGRLLHKRENTPKYDHYSFNARKILFGLYQNKVNIFKEQKAIITEGQFDVITAWQSGLKIVTSSFGAHAGPNHLSLLSRYTNNLYIIYDNDNAGNIGTESIKNMKTTGDLIINFKCPFPPKQDMDNFFKDHTVDDFWKLINYNNRQNKINKLKSIF